MTIASLTKQFPVASAVEELRRVLGSNPCAVLQAPPGAGKTTIVPLALLNEPWLAQKKIVVLAPRRLAARVAAMRMADLLNEKVGRTVGYRVRMDSRAGSKTRIEVVTEGVLTRMLQNDPSLSKVGLVIFDEFHERNLDADLGLALSLDIQGVLNASLRLLVMSATLDTSRVAEMLNGAPVVACSGRTFPVETRYVGAQAPKFSLDHLLQCVLTAVGEGHGSILVFLPGASEIRRLARQLALVRLGPEWHVTPLFGNMTASAQRLAILPAGQGRFKIVLATSIAETSLTIEGIRVVIDSGVQRVPRFDIRSGLTRLVTEPVCKASADQRRGRAGRVEAGLCLRLWSRNANALLTPERRPEICEADLTALALELAAWGIDDAGQLKWLDPPSEPSLTRSRGLLQALNALDKQFKITAHGRRMAALPAHPRLAHMLISAVESGHGAAACDLAALLMERDILRFESGMWDADMQMRFDLLHADQSHEASVGPGATLDRAALRRVRRTAGTLRRQLNITHDKAGSGSLGHLLAWAYPDRIAQRRTGRRGRFLLANGRGARLEETTSLASEAYLVAAELDGKRRQARIFRAAAYDPDTLMEQFGTQLEREQIVAWDPERRAVTASRIIKFDALAVQSETISSPDAELVLSALLKGIRQQGLVSLPWSKQLRRWKARVVFVRGCGQDLQGWPDMTDRGLTAHLDQWLGPYLNGVTHLRELTTVDLKAALYGMLSHEQHRLLDRLAPSHLAVPSGSRIPIDYSGNQPVLAARLQEMFGMIQTPTVAGGRHPLLIHLLSPAGRPVQITQDLAGFWRTGYTAVKKELKGRYPKHYWPDNPLQAKATARTRPKKHKS